MTTRNLDNIPVFAIGKWQSAGGKVTEVTESMLDQIISAFNDLSAQVTGFRPPLKLGHGEAQAFIGQDEGAPAMGWVQALRRTAGVLYADLTNVPAALIDLIRRQHYNSVSIELWPEIEYEGKKFSNVLAGIAILGSELPAVKGLPELSAALFANGAEKIALTEVQEMADAVLKFSQEHVDTFIAAAITKAKDEFAAAHKTQVETLTGELTKEQEARARAETALQVFKTDNATSQVTAIVDEAIKVGTVLPAEKDQMVAFGMAQVATGVINVGDKEMKPLAMFQDILAKRKSAVKFGEKTTQDDADQDKSADTEVDRRAKAAVVADPKLSYSDAVKKVTAEDPALKQAWLS